MEEGKDENIMKKMRVKGDNKTLVVEEVEAEKVE